MGFANLKAVVDAELEGKTWFTGFRKTPAVVTVAGTWYDYSMAPGYPVPQYYAAAPLTHSPLSQSGDGGIPHGGAVTPSTKHVRQLMALNLTAAAVPQRLILLDYIAFVPFIDMGTTGEQTILNPSYTLPRHATGAGVQMMAVLVAPHALAGDTFTVRYTNQAGASDRVTPSHKMTTATAVNGTILTTMTTLSGAIGPFLCLQTGDSGVRSIQGITVASGTDIGLFTIALVKPIADLVIRGIDAPVERDYLTDSGCTLPVVADNAYLNFISHPNGSLSGAQTLGTAKFVWT